MIRKIFAIYDSVAGEVFGPVMILPNEAVAVRTFRDSLFHKDASHREDYDLYCLGTLDTESGVIQAAGEAGSVFGVVAPVVTGSALLAAAEAAQASLSAADGANG